MALKEALKWSTEDAATLPHAGLEEHQPKKSPMINDIRLTKKQLLTQSNAKTSSSTGILLFEL